MGLQARLHQDLQAALKAGRRVELSTLRLLLSAVKNREVEKRGQLTEPEILQLIVKECTQRRDAIHYFRQGGGGPRSQRRGGASGSRAIPPQSDDSRGAICESEGSHRRYGSLFGKRHGKGDGVPDASGGREG